VLASLASRGGAVRRAASLRHSSITNATAREKFPVRLAPHWQSCPWETITHEFCFLICGRKSASFKHYH
jgi:hypothetical protein